jgi:hypothetical protein
MFADENPNRCERREKDIPLHQHQHLCEELTLFASNHALF